MSLKKATILILLILLIDQVSKVYIKTHFVLGEEVAVFRWFKIAFVENDGMAWGAKFSDFSEAISDRNAKLFLTIFRLIAIVGIGFWLYSTIGNKGSNLLRWIICLIFAGALGNIIDSVFYGVLFSSSDGQLAEFLPSDGGYETLMHGHVVDMFHLPIWKGFLPEWLPWFGGKYFVFFEPVFNVADVAISNGFLLLIFLNKRAFKQPTGQTNKNVASREPPVSESAF